LLISHFIRSVIYNNISYNETKQATSGFSDICPKRKNSQGQK